MKKINLIISLFALIILTSCQNVSNSRFGMIKRTNKRGETFTFHGNGTTTVKGPFNEDLGHIGQIMTILQNLMKCN